MSYQTKQQVIGYILAGLLDTELPSSHILKFSLAANQVITESSRYTNDDTLNFATEISISMNYDEEQISELRSSIWWVFDIKTVQEAGYIFSGFAMVFPALNKQ